MPRNLWALRHDGPQSKGLDDLLHLAGSGRTSIPVDREIDAALYRTAGYRVCGERAVRVDILERLADLIRPALAWREGSGPKPPGAVAGGGFTVVNGMTSLTGASGEDFASILRSLGYRMERRPKPQEPQRRVAARQLPRRRQSQQKMAVRRRPRPRRRSRRHRPCRQRPINRRLRQRPRRSEAASLGETPLAADREGAQSAALPAAEFIIPGAPEQPGRPADAVSSTGERRNEASATARSEPGEAAVQPAERTESSASPEALPASGEKEMIEVWRPGRPEGRQRPRPRRRDGRSQARKDAPASRHAEEPSVTAVAGVEAASAPPPEQTPHADSRPSKQGRPPRHRRRPAGEHRPDRAARERERPPVKRFERREKAPDPNSPFAKLAALKAQLEADAKERR